MQIDLRLEARDLLREVKRLGDDIEARVLVRALNRTGTTVRAEAARQVKAEGDLPLKIGEIKRAIRATKATRAKLEVVVSARGRQRIPLTAFGARQTGKGVTVRIGGRRMVIPHAWIAPIRGGRDGVRIRAPGFKPQLFDAVSYRARRISRAGPDYPIAEIMAPGVPQIFIQGRILRALREVGVARFKDVLAQELRYRT